MTTNISYVVLLLAAFIELCVMLMWDMRNLQRNGHDIKRFYSWFTQDGELTTTKRLLILLVLIASFTDMARMSWIVILLLAAVLLIHTLVMLRRGMASPASLDKRSWWTYCLAIVMTLIAVTITGVLGARHSMTDGAQAAAITTVMILAVSPLLSITACWLLRPFVKGHDESQPGAES